MLGPPKASAITAFTLALVAMFGPITIATVVADTLVAAPWEPSDFRWHAVTVASVVLVFALGAILLGRRVTSMLDADNAGWSDSLARAAVAVGAVCATLASIALLSGILRTPSGGPPGLP